MDQLKQELAVVSLQRQERLGLKAVWDIDVHKPFVYTFQKVQKHSDHKVVQKVPGSLEIHQSTARV